MSKIICDVCGTSYPETANQCPICGCVRSGEAVTVRGDTNEVDTNAGTTYTYVKGGRFSKSNVKKRNHGKAPAPVVSQTDKPEEKQGKSDKGIIITVFVLLFAIVAIVIYMTVRFFLPGWTQNDQEQTVNTTEQISTTTEATVIEIPCKALEVSDTVVEFDKAGSALLLNVTPNPADTTDLITYTTSDEKIATVSADGKIVAVGSGEATITIICGTVTTECRVVCTMESTPEETTEPTYSTEDFQFNREDFTMGAQGDLWTLYDGDIPAELITWTTDDEKVATIADGVVTAVGPGYTTVYAEYADIKLSCVVRCAFEAVVPSVDPNEPAEPKVYNYEISDTDVTIKPRETFRIYLITNEGKEVENASFISADSSICTVENGIVTGVKAGKTTVSVTIDGETYSCIVRVAIK